MPTSTAEVITSRPTRYVKQLVSHLGVKAAAAVDGDGRGTIALGAGTCVLRPGGDRLELLAAAPDEAALAHLQDVVARHLVRFATTEELTVAWTPPAGAESMRIIEPLASDYLLTHGTPPDEVLRELAARTREVTGGAARMQVAADEGTLLTMLTRLVGAHLAVEVGVFTGYSTLCIARGLAPGGRLVACDVSEEWAAVGRPFWARAGVADRIDLRIGPAAETLRALPAEPAIDLAFIDGDKEGYPAYYEEIVPRLRPGGLVAVDNVFLGGRVLDPACQQEHHVAMRALNDWIAADDRVDAVMLPVRDGLTLARRR
jgi:predicted O-methyltransferase YrrM